MCFPLPQKNGYPVNDFPFTYECSISCFSRSCFCSLTPWLFRYTQNGILHMLDRNKRIKSKPERFQNCKDRFDLVVTCEERVYDQVVEGEDSLIKCGCDWEIWNCATILLLWSQLAWVFTFVPPLLFLRSEFKRAGNSATCSRHQCRYSG